MTERHGVEIDYCPQCRGVWLDRGELDKIIDKADAGGGGQQIRPPHAHDDRQYRSAPPAEDYRDYDDDDDNRGRGSRRREGFFGELFDF